MRANQVVISLTMALVTGAFGEYHSNRGNVKNSLQKPEELHDYYDDEAPNYKYAYQVNDQDTGDFKNHHETREGDVVKGYYSVKEADGTLREVHYTSDKHNGFNAIVKKSGTPTLEPETLPINHRYEQKKYFLPIYKQPAAVSAPLHHHHYQHQQEEEQQGQPTQQIKHFIHALEGQTEAQPLLAVPSYTSQEN